MTAVLDLNDVKKFYDICNDAYVCWKIRRVILDDNTGFEHIYLMCGDAHCCYEDICRYIAQLAILKIAKLHDSACFKNDSNLSIKYIIKNCKFDINRMNELLRIEEKLNLFYVHIKEYRNKILAHNDRDVVLSHRGLGGFPIGEDAAYFDNLQEFINVASDGFNNGPMPFYEKVSVEAEEFLQVLIEGFKKLYNGSLNDLGEAGKLHDVKISL